MKNILIIVLSSFLLCSWIPVDKKTIDISGQWTVQLDSTDVGLNKGWQNRVFEQKVNLPGTTDDFGIGVLNKLKPGLSKPQLSHLTRKNSYIGAAWYTREITVPSNWKGKEFILKLERVIWKTNVWVDGKEVLVGQNSLVSPHYFNLTSYLIPGKKQRITVRVDNRKQFDISLDNMAHAYTNETQIIWNGIIGEMNIEAIDAVHISNLQVQPNIDLNKVKVSVALDNGLQKAQKAELNVVAVNKKTKKSITAFTQKVQLQKGQSVVSLDYNMGKDVQLWSEFSPELYELKVQLKAGKYESEKTVDFGMRKFSKNGTVLMINDKPVFFKRNVRMQYFSAYRTSTNG